MQPFKDIRVLDLTHVLAGPFCTHQLSVLGADVIKVEPVGRPDMMRQEGSIGNLNLQGLGTQFSAQNSGKRAIALDLASDTGRSLIVELIKEADVLVQNYAGEALDRFDLGYITVEKINPQIIYCSMSGFGQTGPKAGHPAYDVVIQAYTGMMASNGLPDGKPLRIGPPMVDYGTGAQAAVAISAALFQRTRTGKGQFIDVAMADAALMLMAGNVSETRASGIHPTPCGNQHPLRPGYAAFETKSGQIMIGAFTAKQCSDLMLTLGEAVLAKEVLCIRTEDLAGRLEADRAVISKHMMDKTADYWEGVLNLAHIPAARVRTLPEALAEPQIQARGIGVAAYNFAHDGPDGSDEVPLYGQHTDEVLIELGLTKSRISDLRRDRVID